MNPTEFESAPPKVKRRWYRYGLWLLLLSALGYAIVYNRRVAFSVYRAQRLQRATYGGPWTAEYHNKADWERDRAWWRGLAEGNTYTETVRKWDASFGKTVREFPVLADGWELFAGPETSDASLAQADFEILSPVRSFSLHGTQVTDAGMSCLKGLNQLRALNLANTQVTDAGLNSLRGLQELQWLSLGGTRVTDAGLNNLQGLRELQWLSLGGTQVTDAGLENLQGLHELQWLSVARTQVSDAGLAHLEGLSRLESLSLRDTAVTDAGLAHLKGLTRLESLDLSNTAITGRGLEHIEGLTRLRDVNVCGTKVSARGTFELKRVLPDCVIPTECLNETGNAKDRRAQRPRE
jgi:hypothetical protein